MGPKPPMQSNSLPRTFQRWPTVTGPQKPELRSRGPSVFHRKVRLLQLLWRETCWNCWCPPSQIDDVWHRVTNVVDDPVLSWINFGDFQRTITITFNQTTAPQGSCSTHCWDNLLRGLHLQALSLIAKPDSVSPVMWII